MEPFRERLKRLRLERGLSPSALALKVGVTEGAIRQMESGQTKSASFAVGVKLAHALGVDPLFLAVGDATRPATSSGDPAETGSRLEAMIAENRVMIARANERQAKEAQEVQRRLDLLEKRIAEPRPRGQKAG